MPLLIMAQAAQPSSLNYIPMTKRRLTASHEMKPNGTSMQLKTSFLTIAVDYGTPRRQAQPQRFPVHKNTLKLSGRVLKKIRLGQSHAGLWLLRKKPTLRLIHFCI